MSKKTKDVTLSDVLHAIQHLGAELKGELSSVEKRLTDRIDMTEARLSKKIEILEQHVARIDERLTEVEKVKNLFRPELFE